MGSIFIADTCFGFVGVFKTWLIRKQWKGDRTTNQKSWLWRCKKLGSRDLTFDAGQAELCLFSCLAGAEVLYQLTRVQFPRTMHLKDSDYINRLDFTGRPGMFHVGIGVPCQPIKCLHPGCPHLKVISWMHIWYFSVRLDVYPSGRACASLVFSFKSCEPGCLLVTFWSDSVLTPPSQYHVWSLKGPLFTST